MSEMTATRIARVATITLLVVVAAMAVRFLWATDVPQDLVAPAVDADEYLSRKEISRREHHGRFLRIAGVLALAAQLAVLVLLARRVPRVPGPAPLRAVQLGALVGSAVFVAALPFRLSGLWWQRREGIVFLDYGRWAWEQVPPLVEFASVGAVGAAVAVALARRFGRAWWLAGAPALAALGGVVIVAQPLLTPRLQPLDRPVLAQEIGRLAEREGLESPQLEVKRAAKRTRAINAAALGIGPTTRLVFWDTALRLREPELEVLAAHELAHVARRHLWKGLAWFALLTIPAAFAISRLVRLDVPEQVPAAALVAALFALAATPFANVLSRRYEREADWVALEATRDPRAARGLLLRLSGSTLGDPDPPFWSRQLFGTHPPLVERLALTRAWQDRNR